MEEKMVLQGLSYAQLMELIVRSLNRMDERLSGHGERVAWRVMAAAQKKGGFSDDEIGRLIWTVLLHDIGNYQHLDICDLMERETKTANSHARYGYLFLKHFGPYPEEAAVVLYHHSDRKRIEGSGMSDILKWVTQILLAADLLDLYRISRPDVDWEERVALLGGANSQRYHPDAVRVLSEVERCLPTREEIHRILLEQLGRLEISAEEQWALLKVLVSSIDFRSRTTAIHCASIVRISNLLAEFCYIKDQEQQEIRIGTALHDLGKIAIPVSILENLGKLTGEDWEIMKSHIVLTEEILDGVVSDPVKNIAVRHHEALDGSGYPRGLTADELTLPQRIVAVSDVVSALSQERSYKKAFLLEDVVRILEDMGQRGKLCPKVIGVLKNNREFIYEEARETSRQAHEDYEQILQEFSADRYEM